ncbi:hypothetical protein [Amycolatopsis pigmentata]|uniref:Uncharacterized protein n=1 Tax=Amycolatopsis pigmentata TaxID=450801 RepID=A0ABW5FJV6_9PSEU
MYNFAEASMIYCRLADLYRDLDHFLDSRDRQGFAVASQERRDLLVSARELIEHITVADIVYSRL